MNPIQALKMDSNKKITSVKEISDIVHAVLTRIDEPQIKETSLTYWALPDKEFEYYMRRAGATPEAASIAHGSTTSYNSASRENYLITLREAKFTTFFPTYFHETGHAVNESAVNRLKLSTIDKLIYKESLAYSFEKYAEEKFNELRRNQIFMDVFTHNLRKEYLKEGITSQKLKGTPHQRALALLYGMLDIKCYTFEQVYKELRRTVRK